ncbi:hypothetical protein Pan216_29730 [Planctomycetes bacterium Pan216]|uniref:Sulfatase n=1 Tax=Kolteria novifilia TaxID=2527975 RepID=A0A518B551_9BACT|nr:hypothetical protein Pan216_29730 [Planctomycetes bacterium Pan216]
MSDSNRPMTIPHVVPATSRRDFLCSAGGGFGAVALAHLLGQNNALGATAGADNPLAPKKPHVKARAKSVIFLFMEGGPSHIDLFDPKPKLNEMAGKPLPSSFKPVILPMGEADAPLLASKRKWKRHGKSGLWASDWIPEIAECMDDIAVVRSCWSNGLNHSTGMCQMNTGSPLAGRPSLGSWVTYGLGTENQNLPAFIVLEDKKGRVVNGPRNWGTGFMPAVYQGVPLSASGDPIPNLSTPKGVSGARQRSKLDYLQWLNRRHAEPRKDQSELDARIASYELAFRMQAEAPEAVDLASETEETRELYGMDQKETESFGRNCLLARRLVERGVRFVQLYSGSGSAWDSHSAIEKNHARLCKSMDKPVAGLLKDLKRRGLLDETLVVWGGEFGRTPMSEKGNGRDHNPYGFTMWMAGGGVKGGQTIGATDEVGLHAIEERLHVHDLHASILYMLGVDNMELTYLHKGRPERPTQNEGGPCMKLITG